MVSVRVLADNEVNFGQVMDELVPDTSVFGRIWMLCNIIETNGCEPCCVVLPPSWSGLTRRHARKILHDAADRKNGRACMK